MRGLANIPTLTAGGVEIPSESEAWRWMGSCIHRWEILQCLRCTFSPRIINSTSGTQRSRPRLILPAGVAATTSITAGWKHQILTFGWMIHILTKQKNLSWRLAASELMENSKNVLKSRNPCTFDLYLYTDLWSDVAEGCLFNGDVVKLWNHESWEWVLPRKTNH